MRQALAGGDDDHHTSWGGLRFNRDSQGRCHPKSDLSKARSKVGLDWELEFLGGWRGKLLGTQRSKSYGEINSLASSLLRVFLALKSASSPY